MAVFLIFVIDYAFLFAVKFPFLFAEFSVAGRANSPGKANLVLCARMAHQDGLVGSCGKFRHPECFSRGKQDGIAFFCYFSFAIERKVTRPRCENRKAKQTHHKDK
jgi:hypothetical protein